MNANAILIQNITLSQNNVKNNIDTIKFAIVLDIEYNFFKR